MSDDCNYTYSIIQCPIEGESGCADLKKKKNAHQAPQNSHNKCVANVSLCAIDRLKRCVFQAFPKSIFQIRTHGNRAHNGTGAVIEGAGRGCERSSLICAQNNLKSIYGQKYAVKSISGEITRNRAHIESHVAHTYRKRALFPIALSLSRGA